MVVQRQRQTTECNLVEATQQQQPQEALDKFHNFSIQVAKGLAESKRSASPSRNRRESGETIETAVCSCCSSSSSEDEEEESQHHSLLSVSTSSSSLINEDDNDQSTCYHSAQEENEERQANLLVGTASSVHDDASAASVYFDSSCFREPEKPQEDPRKASLETQEDEEEDAEQDDPVLSIPRTVLAASPKHMEDTEPTLAHSDAALIPSRKCVRFGTVCLREYAVTLGDNPGGSCGPPLTLEWEVQEEFILDVEEWQDTKIGLPHRQGEDLRLSSKERTYLLEEHFSLAELYRVSRDCQRVRFERQQTFRQWQAWQACRERICHKCQKWTRGLSCATSISSRSNTAEDDNSNNDVLAQAWLHDYKKMLQQQRKQQRHARRNSRP